MMQDRDDAPQVAPEAQQAAPPATLGAHLGLTAARDRQAHRADPLGPETILRDVRMGTVGAPPDSQRKRVLMECELPQGPVLVRYWPTDPQVGDQYPVRFAHGLEPWTRTARRGSYWLYYPTLTGHLARVGFPPLGTTWDGYEELVPLPVVTGPFDTETMDSVIGAWDHGDTIVLTNPRALVGLVPVAAQGHGPVGAARLYLDNGASVGDGTINDVTTHYDDGPMPMLPASTDYYGATAVLGYLQGYWGTFHWASKILIRWWQTLDGTATIESANTNENEFLPPTVILHDGTAKTYTQAGYPSFIVPYRWEQMETYLSQRTFKIFTLSTGDVLAVWFHVRTVTTDFTPPPQDPVDLRAAGSLSDVDYWRQFSNANEAALSGTAIRYYWAASLNGTFPVTYSVVDQAPNAAVDPSWQEIFSAGAFNHWLGMVDDDTFVVYALFELDVTGGVLHNPGRLSRATFHRDGTHFTLEGDWLVMHGPAGEPIGTVHTGSPDGQAAWGSTGAPWWSGGPGLGDAYTLDGGLTWQTHAAGLPPHYAGLAAETTNADFVASGALIVPQR